MGSFICVEVFLCLEHLLHHKDLSPGEGCPHLLAAVCLVSGLAALWRQRPGGQRPQPEMRRLQPVLACHRGGLSVRPEDVDNEMWSKLVIAVTLPELGQRLCPHDDSPGNVLVSDVRRSVITLTEC